MTADLKAGQLISGRYRLEKLLGTGGMGEVWQARHLSLQNDVALKFLKGHWAAQRQSQRRFELEARITAQLKTRWAVQVFDFGLAEQGQPFLAMELLSGESLADRLRREQRLSPALTVQLLGQAAKALERAHALGIVHRDFKPGNVFIVRDEEGHEQVKVMDFGIAKLVGELEAADDPSDTLLNEAGAATFTRTGTMMGTPAYMSPEQVDARAEIGPPADVWALAVVAFECLTGVLPFMGLRLNDLFEAIRQRRYLKASLLTEVAPAFDDWFETTCASDPKARPVSPVAAWSALAVSLAVTPSIGSASEPMLTPVTVSGATPLPLPASSSPAAAVALAPRAPARSRRLWLALPAVAALAGAGWFVTSRAPKPEAPAPTARVGPPATPEPLVPLPMPELKAGSEPPAAIVVAPTPRPKPPPLAHKASRVPVVVASPGPPAPDAGQEVHSLLALPKVGF